MTQSSAAAVATSSSSGAGAMACSPASSSMGGSAGEPSQGAGGYLPQITVMVNNQLQAQTTPTA